MSNIEGWRELESDPGLFTLLIEDMGVKGVEVEEIYDLSEPIDRQIYGFIFLFKWTKDRRSRRMMQEQLQAEQFAYDTVIADKIFFAQQIIPNSCATHALLSILLNSSSIDVGETLSEFRQFTKDHNPEVKGLAIGNVSKLVKAHNNHARPENRHQFNTRGSVSHGQSAETFHFVSYVPIDGHLYELDGLKPYPIDHGILPEGENWTETFRRVIKTRLGMETQGEPCHEIRYNLMSIVVDKRITLLKMMFILVNCQNVVKAATAKVKQLVKENQQRLRYRSGKKLEQDMLYHDLVNENKKLLKILKEMYAKLDSCETQEADDIDGIIPHNNNYKNETCQLDEKMNIDKLNVFENSDSSKEKYQDGQNSTDDILENDKAAKNSTVLDATESNDNQILNDCVKNNSTIKKRQKKARNGTKDDFKATKRKANIGSNDIKLINGVVESIMNSTIVTIGVKDKLPNLSEDAVFMDKNRKFIKESLNDLDDALSPREVIDVVADLLLVRLEEINISCLDIIWNQEIRESRLKSYSKFNAVHHEHNYFKNSPDFFLPAEVKILKEINKNLELRLRKCDEELNEEIEKRKRYAVDNCRRIHNYDPFISTFLKMLADSDLLLELVERNCELSKRQIRYGKKSPFNNRKRIRSMNKSDRIKKKGKNLAT